MITNQIIKQIRELTKKAKARRETALFVAEGERLVSEVPDSSLEEVYVTEEYAASHEAVKSSFEILPLSVFQKLSDTKTPQGILAVVRRPAFDMEQVLSSKNGRFLLLETLQDPGNLGTIFRTAEGAGMDGIFFNRETVDIYGPKTVRSTMGSIFRVPHFEIPGIGEGAALLKKRGVKLYAAALSGSLRYDEPDYRGPSAFLIGNEGNGLTEEALALADFGIRIPMAGRLESLNAGVAAALLMYESARQRGFF